MQGRSWGGGNVAPNPRWREQWGAWSYEAYYCLDTKNIYVPPMKISKQTFLKTSEIMKRIIKNFLNFIYFSKIKS